ncbi:MAG: bifunctional [glutamine synthetase] adenylyltransferase/[glutamine synthetase]-adenylyl-L-tyrosine phosphorylase [Geminicoccaceae bacterium]|nr:MAG: bifunctional [glutamine synthetase] adenylyltransferase/[glutamine synthetase]-adenylyl-L-tyrosine phosphorylase [Geminicoccaceae bacterium]
MSARSWPRPFDAARATRERERFVAASVDGADRALRQRLVDDARPMLDAVFGNSPYLTGLVHREADLVEAVATKGAAAALAAAFEELDDDHGLERSRLMAALRRTKRRVALATALGDLGGELDGPSVTQALSRLADQASDLALRLMLRFAVDRGEVDPGVLEAGAQHGLIVLGMGKLGAFELNYSSDIDLIVFLDPERLAYRGRETPIALAAKVTRGIAQLLAENHRDGYVFRTDLRLRPFPAGQPMALTVDAAENYYARHGQNWERAAMIKARPIAGDIEAGEAFLRRIAPFIWRRSLDYAAINDIHSIKRQIHAHRGHGRIKTLGHNVKLGRGGIREIEFFCQTQQLILGGRVPSLRERATTAALNQLAETGWIDQRVCDDLVEAYWYLRRIEHRLQMVDDAQTHNLPESEAGLERLAVFLAYPGGRTFEAELTERLVTVERHYAGLFEASPDLSDSASLVFTGTDDDPDTLQHLAKLGFADPAGLSQRVREWHHGHIAATRSARARELLTELMPDLLHALSRQRDPETAFRRFDAFLTSLPAGVQLFSLFHANPGLLKLIALIMGTAPRMAERLAANTRLFEAMLTPAFIEALPPRALLAAELDETLAASRYTEDLLDRARVWGQARQFQVELMVLIAHTSCHKALPQLTAIADLLLDRLLGPVEDWLARSHGRIEGGRFAVLGFGKLGSKELTIGSDLDLVFVFDAPEDAKSDGEKPLSAPTYYARLGQRLISALSAPTAEGRLFEIDMRLRPSGNAGPLTCTLQSFTGYQERTAQIWEHQALSRARPVAGDPSLRAELAEAIAQVLRRPRERGPLAEAVVAMRRRIFNEHGTDDVWDVKHAPGGLVSIEFLAQFLVLLHAPEHQALLGQSTGGVFAQAFEQGLLAADEADALVAALRLQHAIAAVVRLTVEGKFDPTAAPEALQAALLAAAQMAIEDDQAAIDLATLERHLAKLQRAVERIAAGHYGLPEPMFETAADAAP